MKRKKFVKNNRSDGFSLKHEYKESFKFLKECKWYVLFVAVLFFVISFFVYSGVQSQELNKVLLEYLKKVVSQFEGKGVYDTVLMIFSNNLFTSILGIVFGIFFGIFPVIFIIVNAYAIGFVAQKSVDVAGIAVLWKLFPHGIFELPAVFISFALGIKLGTFVFAVHPWQKLKELFFKSMKVFFYIILPLLVIAAIIEGVLIVLMG